jgi:hypothetical protein
MHRSTVLTAVSSPAPAGREDHDRCAVPAHRVAPRPDCIRDMDRRIAEAIRRHGLTRGAALALYGEAVATYPEDPCSARQLLEDALGDLTLV